MIYSKEVGTKVFCFVLFRTFRFKILGKGSRIRPAFEYENICNHRHLTLGAIQFSVMPIKEELWHNF